MSSCTFFMASAVLAQLSNLTPFKRLRNSLHCW
ncbi:Uncharacterised protein [Vibrio cholerae]|nr:Uncharacterised protein [Vibrio cholerae]